MKAGQNHLNTNICKRRTGGMWVQVELCGSNTATAKEEQGWPGSASVSAPCGIWDSHGITRGCGVAQLFLESHPEPTQLNPLWRRMPRNPSSSKFSNQGTFHCCTAGNDTCPRRLLLASSANITRTGVSAEPVSSAIPTAFHSQPPEPCVTTR